MSDTARIRKTNIQTIRKILLGGGKYTKQQVAHMTGLSVATCNTILNEMEAAMEVIGEKEHLRDVGRSTTVYCFNENFEYVLCLEYRVIQEVRSLSYAVMSLTGCVIEQNTISYPFIDEKIILQTAQTLLVKFPQISIISVGTPSIAEHGIVRHCDLPEMEGASLVERLNQIIGVPVIMENDMHIKTYGYYKKHCRDDNIVSLVNFPAHVLPGTSTIVSGRILKGANHFAGMVGFLQHGVSREEEISQLIPDKYFPYAVRSIIAIIVLLNPSIILCSGDLLNEQEVEKMRLTCLETIPEEYLPAFRFLPDMEDYFREGMFQLALDKKGEL